MEKSASADGGKEFITRVSAKCTSEREGFRTSGAVESDREVFVRANPPTEAAVCNAAGLIRILRVGP